MIGVQGTSLQLTVPVYEAVAFAMGWTNLGYPEPAPAMRRLVGELAVDQLHYSEEWRVAEMLRERVRRNWS